MQFNVKMQRSKRVLVDWWQTKSLATEDERTPCEALCRPRRLLLGWCKVPLNLLTKGPRSLFSREHVCARTRMGLCVLFCSLYVCPMAFQPDEFGLVRTYSAFPFGQCKDPDAGILLLLTAFVIFLAAVCLAIL